MANGNGNGNGNGVLLPPWKVIGLAITASLGISGISMTVMSDRISQQADELHKLQAEMNKGERYTESDARRDFGYASQRMERIEARDERCEARMNEHLRRHPAK